MTDIWFNIRAQGLREALWGNIDVPPHKSINRAREELIAKEFEAVESEARQAALRDNIYATGKSPEESIAALAHFKGCFSHPPMIFLRSI